MQHARDTEPSVGVEIMGARLSFVVFNAVMLVEGYRSGYDIRSFGLGCMIGYNLFGAMRSGRALMTKPTKRLRNTVLCLVYALVACMLLLVDMDTGIVYALVRWPLYEVTVDVDCLVVVVMVCAMSKAADVLHKHKKALKKEKMAWVQTQGFCVKG